MPAPKSQRPNQTNASSVPQGGILSRILDVSSLTFTGEKWLIYGHSGTGKTRFFSTFGSKGKMLHIICSGNGVNEAMSIRGMPNIKAIELMDPSELPVLMTYARKNDFYGVCLDHVTDFTRMILREIIKKDVPEILNWGIATQSQWGLVTGRTVEHLKLIQEFPGVSVIIGQQRTYGAEEDGGQPIAPYVNVSATPGVAGWLGPACDYIVQTYKWKEKRTDTKMVKGVPVTTEFVDDKVGYFLRTGPSEVFTTKFRVPPNVAIPDYVKDPTYDKLAQYLG